MNTDKLEALLSPKKSSKPEWAPPTIDQFRNGNVIAFDPSLGACGVVALHCQGGELMVYAVRTFKTDEILEVGHEGNLQRFDALERKIGYWMREQNFAADWQIVHEAPPASGTMMRPESSLLAGAAVRMATRGYCLRPMVGRQRHAKFICGNGNAKKPVHHAALKKLAVDLNIANFSRVTNEATRDACSVGLAFLAGL